MATSARGEDHSPQRNKRDCAPLSRSALKFLQQINASILSEVVRQLRLDQSNGFDSGTLSIEPFGGSRCRGALATTYAFSMVFSWSEKEREASSAEKRTPKKSDLERDTLLRTSDGCPKPSLSECTDRPPATELETTQSECRRVVDG